MNRCKKKIKKGGGRRRRKRVLHQIIIINLVTILKDLSLNLRRIDPRNIILHIPCDQSSRVINDLGAHSDVALLHKGNSGLKVRGHLVADHHDREPSPAEGRDPQVVAESEALLGLDDAHAVELLEEVLRDFLADGVLGGHRLELGNEGSDVSTKVQVLDVVLALLDVKAADDFGLFEGFVVLPVDEVCLLEQLLFVVLELPDHCLLLMMLFFKVLLFFCS